MYYTASRGLSCYAACLIVTMDVGNLAGARRDRVRHMG